MPARLLRFRGEVSNREEGDRLLEAPGDAVMVHRGVIRSLLLKCPDGCGENSSINLDPRAGKVWGIDTRGGQITLYPSVWREGGCKSHFILWRGKIVWSERYDRGNIEPDYDSKLETLLLSALTDTFRTSVDLAGQLDEIPWDVSRAGHVLVRRGLAECGGRDLSSFRRKAAPKVERFA